MVLSKFVMFGDSITQFSSNASAGFCILPQMQNDYMRRLDVVARGFSGYNSAYANGMIEPLLNAEINQTHGHVDLMTIFFGTNDVADNDQQHVSKDDYISNMRNIVQHVKKYNISVILVAPGPVDEKLEHERSTRNMKEYGIELGNLAKSENVGFVNLWYGFLDSLGWKDGDAIPGQNGTKSNLNLDNLLVKGLHFKPEGYKVYYKLLSKEIANKYPDLKPSNLTEIMPSWSNIDNKKIDICLFPKGW